MKPKIVLVGIIVFAVSIVGYEFAPRLITRIMNKFTGGVGDQHLMKSMMAQMGIPPVETLVPVTEFSMIGIALAGLGVMIYGMMSRRQTDSSLPKAPKNVKNRNQKNESNQETINMLKDSLANGEITYEQYQDILKRMEPKDTKL